MAMERGTITLALFMRPRIKMVELLQRQVRSCGHPIVEYYAIQYEKSASFDVNIFTAYETRESCFKIKL